MRPKSRRMTRLLLLSLFALLAPVAPAAAVPAPPPADPGWQCRAAIAAAERGFGIPAGLMAAIGRIESGRRGADGRVDPWPWSIDAEGNGRMFDSKPAAVAAVRSLQAAGVRSIDVGCMQVNLLHHPDAFDGLDAAFDPVSNVGFAARFLLQLRSQTGSWPEAAALYHSATPALAADYRRKVMAAWPVALAEAGAAASPAAWGVPAPPAAGRLGAGGTLPARILPNGRLAPHLFPLAPGRNGRSLAAYRAAPVPLAAPVPAPPRGPG